MRWGRARRTAQALGEPRLLHVNALRLLQRRRARVHDLPARAMHDAREAFPRDVHRVGAERERGVRHGARSVPVAQQPEQREPEDDPVNAEADEGVVPHVVEQPLHRRKRHDRRHDRAEREHAPVGRDVVQLGMLERLEDLLVQDYTLKLGGK